MKHIKLFESWNWNKKDYLTFSKQSNKSGYYQSISHDEYYLVSLQDRDPNIHKFWKCDQLDGLIMFLEDKFLK